MQYPPFPEKNSFFIYQRSNKSRSVKSIFHTEQYVQNAVHELSDACARRSYRTGGIRNRVEFRKPDLRSVQRHRSGDTAARFSICRRRRPYLLQKYYEDRLQSRFYFLLCTCLNCYCFFKTDCRILHEGRRRTSARGACSQYSSLERTVQCTCSGQ